MSPAVLKAADTLREFLFDRVYNRHSTEEEASKAREIIRFLYGYYAEHETSLPQEYSIHSDETARRVVDYIAGMTDRYAAGLAEELER